MAGAKHGGPGGSSGLALGGGALAVCTPPLSDSVRSRDSGQGLGGMRGTTLATTRGALLQTPQSVWPSAQERSPKRHKHEYSAYTDIFSRPSSRQQRIPARSTHDSEILEYMASRGGKVLEQEETIKEFATSNKTLEEKVRTQHRQLISLEAELAARTQVQEAEFSRDAKTTFHLDELLHREMAKSKDLSKRLQSAQEQMRSAQDKNKYFQRQMEEAEAQHTHKVNSLEQQKVALKHQLTFMEHNWTKQKEQLELVIEIEQKSRESEAKAHRLTRTRLEFCEQQISEQQQRATQLEEQLQILEARARRMEAKAAHNDNDESLFLIKSLQEELRTKNKELREAEPLKKQALHVSTLKDRLASAEMRAKLAEAGLADKDDILAQLEKCKEENEQWRSAIKGTGQSTLEPQILMRMQKEMLDLRQAVADKDSDVVAIKREREDNRLKQQEFQEKVQSQSIEIENSNRLLQVAQGRIAILSKERDSAKRMVWMMNQDDEVYQEDDLSSQAFSKLSARAKQQALQIEELNKLNQEHQKQAQEMERHLQEVVHAQRDHKVEVHNLMNEIESLKEERDNVQTQNRQDFDGATTRVLHMVHNPEAEAHKADRDLKWEQLEAENLALKKQIETIEARGEKGNATHNGVPSGGVATAMKDAEMTILQRRRGELEKQMARLKDVFKDRIAIFREACFLLFGYKVDMVSEATKSKDSPATLSLKPHRSDDADALLMFKLTKENGIELLPTSYSDKLSREIETFITKYHSVPAFVANLTMEQFQKETQY